MSEPMAVAVMVLGAVLILALMAWGWHRRSRRDADVVVPLGDAMGDVVFDAAGFYVATTRHDEPLNRIAARPLAYRGRAQVTVTSGGIGLAIAGEQSIFIAAPDVIGADRATWTIDRVVERDGLVLVAWQNGSAVLDTYLRLPDDDPATLIEAIERIASADTPTGAKQ